MKANRTWLTAAGALLFAAGLGTGMAVELAAQAGGGRPAEPRAAEPALERGNLAPGEQLALMLAVAENHLEKKDYGGAIAWAQRYLKAGGAESEARPVLVEAYFRSGDFTNAARELQWEIQAAERAGRPPAEDRLLQLQLCYQRLDDAAAIVWSLEKLVTYHPRPEYWADLLNRTEKRPGFGEHLVIEINRLRLRTDVLAGPDGYLQYAAQAQQAGYPAEARAVIEQGIARRVLGTGPDGRRHRQLLQQLTHEAAAQRRQLADPKLEAEAAAARDGIELVKLGFAHVSHGNHPKGLQLMEQGIRKGGGLANRPQIATLELGIAYLMAGQRAKAIEHFKTITGKHGGVELGRLWAIHAQQQR